MLLLQWAWVPSLTGKLKSKLLSEPAPSLPAFSHFSHPRKSTTVCPRQDIYSILNSPFPLTPKSSPSSANPVTYSPRHTESLHSHPRHALSPSPHHVCPGQMRCLLTALPASLWPLFCGLPFNSQSDEKRHQIMSSCFWWFPPLTSQLSPQLTEPRGLSPRVYSPSSPSPLWPRSPSFGFLKV